jgi:hypothetical protein
MMPKKKMKKCIVINCSNRNNEGGFIGNLCSPCYAFITTGKGRYSQMYRNSVGIVLREVGQVLIEKGEWNEDFIRDSSQNDSADYSSG